MKTSYKFKKKLLFHNEQVLSLLICFSSDSHFYEVNPGILIT